jgi:hypothetical protein
VPGLFDWVSLAFFSVLTAGILPVVFVSMARARRRRLRRFLKEGTPATATIHSIDEDKLPFEAKIAKVAYEFEADGGVLHDVDRIQVLYLPHAEYDSVIIST